MSDLYRGSPLTQILMPEPIRQGPVIYTAGYSRTEPAELATLALALRAVVVDIRYSPRSRRSEWAGENLKWTLKARGVRYEHERGLGNVNYGGRGPIKLLDPDGAIKRLRPILEWESVILLCICADVSKCHRMPAAEALASGTSREIVHLTYKQIKAGRI